MTQEFDYATAFSRNIGWMTPWEQEVLRGKRVAIAGMGGVGGSHLLTLVRLGVGRFNLADLDTFELANFNRQAGASLATVGKEKVRVLAERALDINPELDLRIFDKGVSPENNREFLQDVDLYLDGLDFFAVEARRAIFGMCKELGIPAVTAAPLGMGTAVINFLPGEMSFEEYFQLEGQELNEQLLRFFVGLAPKAVHRHALVDPSTIDLPGHRGPSTAMGCELCAGAAATQVLKILLHRGKVWPAPHALQYDAYSGRQAHAWRPGGNRHPLQRLALNLARRHFIGRPPAKGGAARPTEAGLDTAILRILDLARWAPSGDNTQPWRFEILSDDRFVIHGSDTRDWCVYDLEGRASQLAIGALLENIRIAARGEGLSAKFSIREGMDETQPTIDVTLAEDADAASGTGDTLLPFMKHRATQRRPLSTMSLTASHRAALEQSVGEAYTVRWLDQPQQKRDMARLLYQNAKIRLTIKEAYEVHKRIIEWDAETSADKIPDAAIGLDVVNLKAMRWAMQSWDRVSFLNRFFAGTVIPRLILDYRPALHCAAHFLIVAEQEPTSLQGFLDAGGALQRFWLTAASLGIQFQPQMTPLIFSGYVRQGRRFTESEKAQTQASQLRDQLDRLVGKETAQAAVFMGRVGYGPPPKARSVRLGMDRLIKN